MAKVAVIIPAYNAAGSIERTVRNVLAQSLRDIEVWVTDDGSRDATGEILDRLCAEDCRLHVIHQENCGAYQARLVALRQITTPYFGFVDADDEIEPQMFERLLSVAENHGLDVVQCQVWGRTSEKVGLEIVDEDCVGEKVVGRYLLDVKESCFIWDKLYRNQYDFGSFELTDRMTNFDDLIFNFQFFRPVRRFGFLHEGLYHYTKTDGSAVHSFSDRHLSDFRQAIRLRAKFCVWYGVQTDDSVMDRWVVRNLRNALVTAATAKMLTLRARVRFVRKLLSMPEVQGPVLRCREFGIVSVARWMPSSCFVLGLMLAKLVRR